MPGVRGIQIIGRISTGMTGAVGTSISNSMDVSGAMSIGVRRVGNCGRMAAGVKARSIFPFKCVLPMSD